MVLKPGHFSRPLAKADKRGGEACLSLNITWLRLEFEEILELAEVSGVRQMRTADHANLFGFYKNVTRQEDYEVCC